jgi:hypothetical protein
MMISMALVLAMGCGKKEIPEPQEQAKAPSKPALPDSKKGQPKPTPKKETPQPKTGPKSAVQKPGTVLWEFETGGQVESSPAIGSDGTVYIGSKDKKLYAIKTDSKGLAKSPWPMRGQNTQHTGRAPKK